MSKIVLDTILTTNNLASLNANFVALADELNNKVLYRDNPVGEVNTLLDNIDCNSNFLYNLPEPTLDHQVATKAYVDDTVGDAPVQAAASAAAAAASAVEAAGYAADIGDGILPLVTPALGDATADSLDVNGAFTSPGIDDNATATALTLSGSGANHVTIANSVSSPMIGTSAGDLSFSPAGVAGRASLGANFFGINGATGSASGFVANAATGFNGLYAFHVNNSEVARFSANAGGIVITTGSTALTQLAVLHTDAANHFITLTGSNGGNPTIGTSAGSLALSSTTILCGTATGTDYGSIYSQTGQISFIPQGSSANISTGIYSKGNSGIFFATGTVSATQVSINNTAAANRYITLTGSNGGNPTIGTSAGGLGISADVVADGFLQLKAGTATTAGGIPALYMGTSAHSIGFGSGAPTYSALKGSLYLRSDGSTTNNRMYVNTDGGTTWTALITAA